MKQIVPALVLAASVSVCAAASVPFVEKGVARACLVLPDDAPTCAKASAAEFVTWTRELTGVSLPVGPSAVQGLVPVTLTLDENDARVKNDGFRLTVSPKGISVVAREPFGIVHAAYWMLNRFGRIWWCDPESGADFAKTETFAVPEGVFEENPLPNRNGLRPGGAPADLRRKVALWNLRNGFVEQGVSDEVRAEFGLPSTVRQGGHALGDMVISAPVDKEELDAEIRRIVETGANKTELNAESCDKKSLIEMLARYHLQLKHHPERLPLIDGKRCPSGVTLRSAFRGKVGNPCLSNPSTRQYLLETIRRQKAENAAERGGRIRYEYGFMCDDNSQWCECDDCMKLILAKGSTTKDDRTSDYWWDFLNWMTPRLLEDRDVSVEAGIYLTYRQPPVKVTPVVADPTRQSVLICPHGRCYFHPLGHATCKGNPRFVKMFEDWSRFGIPIRTFEYHCQLPGKGNYAFFEKAWVSDLKWYRAHAISHTSGGLFGPWTSYYGKGTARFNAHPEYRYGAKARWQIINLTGHFAWDTGDDFETVRRDLLTAYYRSAAKEMLAYHALLENALDRNGICMSYGSSKLPFVAAMAEPGLAEKALALLDAADKAAGGDAELKRRIARDKFFFKLDWESAAAASAGVKTMPLHRATGAVALDGVLDEATWKGANVSDDWRWMKTYNVDNAAPDPFLPRTKMLTAFDNDNLYLGFVCQTTPGEKETDVPDDGTMFSAMRGGHLEIAVQSPAQNGEYFHLALSHNGKRYSALTSSPSTRDVKVKCDFAFAVKDASDGWTAELSLPLKDFGSLPKEGEVWRVGAYRCTVGAEGATLEGSSTGFPLHWMDRWEAFAFGRPGNLVPNGSFERGQRAPDGKQNGRNWKFRQADAPSGWSYHSNGGDLDWCDGDAADGRRFVRLRPVNAHGGPEFVVTGNFPLYPPATQTLKVSFAARGKGMIRIYSFAHKALVPVEIDLDSTDWKRYERDLSLWGTHPAGLTFRFVAGKGDQAIDIDDVAVVPAEPDVEAVRFDAARLLVERVPSKKLVVADNLAWLREGKIPAYAVNNVVRWLAIMGVDMTSCRPQTWTH